MADITVPVYQYTPLQHPESIRILNLHPAEDRNAPIVCSFLDENPIVPKIEEWECRAVDPRGCTGDCFYGPIDEESSYGSDEEFPCDSAEYPEDKLADEMQELAIENTDHADDDHYDKPVEEGDDGISTGDNHIDADEESGENNGTDDGLCSECGYDRFEEEHKDEKNDDDCPCDCHNDESVGINDTENVVSSPRREWHEKVFRSPGFPEYEALSYTWGDASDPLPITVGSGGARIMVTRNCHGALRNLRLQTSDRLLWIDAICINQKDDLEKTVQVRMMGRVYAASYQVVIYLGDETPSSRILFEELALAEDAPLVLKGNRRELDRPHPRPELVEAMDHLLDRPWFNRVWVLQEAYNSKLATVSDAAVICGSSSSRTSLLYDCIFGYRGNRVTRHRCPFPIAICRSREKKRRLWRAIYDSLGCAATDSRDRIFALQGLVGENNADFNDIINYTDGFELTFLKVAQYLLKYESNLVVLSLIMHPHQMAMPSWVPSWTDVRENEHIRGELVHLKSDSFVSANGKFEIRFESCVCERCAGKHGILQVKGFEVSVIEHIGTPFTTSDPFLLEEQVRHLLCKIDESTPWDHKTVPKSPDEIILQGS
ncbi:Heterokaryon incompatibility protein 6, OR allele [Colletotrichum siamense]|nr:Heterokaryon incompatibility protein 6, OR allele [Colletotrichum siamense]